MKDSRLPKETKIDLFDKIYHLILTTPNNYDLGEAIRKIVIPEEENKNNGNRKKI
jgi:hypothetical protein